MGTRRIDLTGGRFGSLFVVKEIEERNKNGHILYECKCDCGNVKAILGSSLRSGSTKSCGCRQKRAATKHGYDGTPTYRVWVNMKSRCLNSNDINYHKYGARGISVCRKWLVSFNAFLKDMGEKPDGKSIDRIDNDGDYTPQNCKWSTPREQALNRRSTVMVVYNGRKIYVHEYAKEVGLTESGARKRAKRLGIIVKEADL